MKLSKGRRLSSTRTVKNILSYGTHQLTKQHFPSASLEAEILLARVLKRPKEYLYTYPEKIVSLSCKNRFKKLLEKRLKHAPISYLTRTKEFYELDFYVDTRVLIPRPETEALVEKALDFIRKSITPSIHSKNTAIIDIGTGSGCIIISIVKTMEKEGFDISRMRCIATDISKKALVVARRNAARHGVETYITFYKGHLLEPVMERLEARIKKQELRSIIILANLPYITPTLYKTLAPDIKSYEPREALLTPTGDPDYYYKELDKQIKQLESIIGRRIATFYERGTNHLAA